MKFKLLDATNLSTPLSCDPDLRSQKDPQHCPTVRLCASGCDAEGEEDIRATLWNENQDAWVADQFNNLFFDFAVSANLSTCSRVWIELGRYVPVGSVALVIDEVRFSQKTTFAPTPSPTVSPTKAKTTGPTLSLMRMTISIMMTRHKSMIRVIQMLMIT